MPTENEIFSAPTFSKQSDVTLCAQMMFALPEGGEVVMEPVSMEVLSKEARSKSASSLAETMRSLAPRPPLPPPPEEEDGGQGGAAASKAAEKAETESSVFSRDEAPSSERGLEGMSSM